MQRMLVWETTRVPGYPATGDALRRLAEQAAGAGATHFSLNTLPKSTWQRGDARDPHPEWEYWTVWSRPAIGLFKLVLPPELEPWIPRDEVERNLALVEGQCAILREFGLRVMLDGHEPMWWPEGAFRAHPRWRGPEVQHPGISRVSYHSPCLDQPEVLAIYRHAMGELCRRLPEVDAYTMLTNDSSAGLCWAHTYPGKNGPLSCRKTPLIDRITGFFDALQDGARDAGREIVINMYNAGFWIDGAGHYRASLREGQYIDGVDRQDRVRMSGSGSNSFFGGYNYPALGIPKVFSFVEEIERAFAGTAEGVSISVATDESLLTDVFMAFRETPSHGPASRMDILRRVAAARVGTEHAETLLDIWQAIEKATEQVRYVLRGSPMIIVGPLMARWVIMPLVPDVYSLSAEETAYFQHGRLAKTEIEALDLQVAMGWSETRGKLGVNHARLEYLLAIDKLDGAAASATALAGNVVDPAVAAHLSDLARRLRVLASLYRTTKNFIEYGYRLATCDEDDEHHVLSDVYSMGGGPNKSRWLLCTLAREEMDNALALAQLIEESPEPLLAMAPTPEEEDGFLFGPNLVEQLQKKVEIMLDHWPEYNALYPPPGSQKTKTRPATLADEGA
jgi:hypothetical protein